MLLLLRLPHIVACFDASLLLSCSLAHDVDDVVDATVVAARGDVVGLLMLLLTRSGTIRRTTDNTTRPRSYKKSQPNSAPRNTVSIFMSLTVYF